MTPVEDALRQTLHRLAPEPPEDVELAGAARRRARHVRRARYAGVAAVAVVAAAAVAVPAFVAPRSDLRPAAGSLHAWPRRGDLRDPAVDRAAIAAWDAALRTAGARRQEARIVYGGGGDRPVVVLYGLADRGGERLVVVTGDRGRFSVYADRPAPAPATVAVSIVLDPPEPERADAAGPCVPDPLYDDAAGSRLLVVGGPALRSARWRIEGTLPVHCADEGNNTTAWQDVPLEGGAALVAARLGRRGSVNVDMRGRDSSRTGAPTVAGPLRGDYAGLRMRGFVPTVDGARPLDWRYRADGSRAVDLAGALEGRPDIAGRYRGCVVYWAASLPDGTPAVLCASESVSEGRRMLLLAEGPDRRLRIHLSAPLGMEAYVTVVEGLTGYWLVAVGAPHLTRMRHATVGEEVPLTTVHGTAFARVDAAATGAVHYDGGSAAGTGVARGPVELVSPRRWEPDY